MGAPERGRTSRTRREIYMEARRRWIHGVVWSLGRELDEKEERGRVEKVEARERGEKIESRER